MRGTATFIRTERAVRGWLGGVKFKPLWYVVGDYFKWLCPDGVETGLLPCFEGPTLENVAERLVEHMNATYDGIFILHERPRAGKIAWEVVPL